MLDIEKKDDLKQINNLQFILKLNRQVYLSIKEFVRNDDVFTCSYINM